MALLSKQKPQSEKQSFESRVSALADQVRALEAPINSLIDEWVAGQRSLAPGVPGIVLEKLLRNRAPDNPWRQLLILEEEG